MEPPRQAARLALTLAAWALLAAAALPFARFLKVAATRQSIGFSTLYTSARLVLEGSPLGQVYDDAWFGAQVRRFTPDVGEVFRPNPPAAALLATPVAWMPHRSARIAWTLLSLAALAATGLWAARRLDVSGPGVPLLGLGLLLFEPVDACLSYGQAYLILTALLVLAYEGLRRDAPARAGLSLGALLAFKLAVPLAAVLLLSRHRRRALGFALGAAGAIAAVSLVWPGPRCWLAWLRLLHGPSGLAGRPEEAVTAYQTLPGLVAHLTRHDPRWNPSPWLDAPLAGRLAGLLLPLLLGAASLARAAVSRSLEAALSLLVLASLLASPWTLDYHLVLALVPVVLLAGILRSAQRPWREGAWLALGTLLLSAPAAWCQPHPVALLAYPRLAGGLLLWSLAFSLAVSEARTRAPGPA